MAENEMKKTTGIILILYLVTWLPAVVIIGNQRRVHHPRVYPILPFIVLSCDKSPSLAGEWALYVSYAFGVKELLEIRTWIA